MKANTETPLISVVIPVYNVKEYIERGFQSLRNQTYSNIEVIYVDDCSTDGSFEECIRLCATDPRFKALRMIQNSGAGNTRQYGIEQATGTYVGFVDADDFADPDMYTILYHTLAEHQADIACANAYYEYEDGSRKPIFPPSTQSVLLSTKEAIVRMHHKQGIGYSLWDKLFRRDLWLKHPMRTQPFEDHAVLPYLFQSAQRIALCSQPLYHYVQRQGSLMHSKFNAQKEFAAFMLFYHETRLLEQEYGVIGLNTVVRKGVHYLNHLCVLPLNQEHLSLYQQTVERMHEYDHLPMKMGLILRLKRYFLLHHYNAYRKGYILFMKTFKRRRYNELNG